MQIGAQVHRRLQSEAGGLYTPEVSLSNTTLYEGLYYTVSGRADGIIRGENVFIVDEIKCVRGGAFFAPPTSAHLGQLKCYAYFLCLREGFDRIDARLTYYNIDNENVRYFNYRFKLYELREFYLGLLERVKFFADLTAHRELDVLPQAANARFPYSGLREGQEMMIRECFGAIKRGQRLFVEAPTGTGKTISSLFPAVRALGQGMIDKVFYLTAKSSTRSEAYAAAKKLFASGVGIRAIVLNSKESVCACGRARCSRNMCNPDECSRAVGYYDKVNDALREILSSSNGYPYKSVRAVADKYGICPYELSLDLSEFCDVIICDYNYAFDPSVYLRRYFAPDGRRERYAFLIDEAHNLADRARDMYSAQLTRSDFDAIAALDASMGTLIGDALSHFYKLGRMCTENYSRDEQGVERGFFISHSPLESFCAELELCRKRCDAWLRKNEDSEYYEAVYELAASIRKYLCVSEYFDKGFLCYVELCGEQVSVKTYCLDPSGVMNTLLHRAVASVMFSATLTPYEYFSNVLGCAKTGVGVSLPSPFEASNLCVSVADFVSTRYDDREASIKKYVSVIAATVSAKAGNYIAYFPSYDCLERVHHAFTLKYPHITTVAQKRGNRYADKEEFLGSFKDDSGRTRIGFCVLGGAFSEGVDLPGHRLIGAIIFGVGLPGLSNERNIMRDYFEQVFESGYDYAYTYPGMNNVLQAAGRVIRTETDCGVVVLADDRYASPLYRQLFPDHWQGVQYAGNAASLAEILRRFWKNKG
jgi:Rad3-related DNA helicase